MAVQDQCEGNYSNSADDNTSIAGSHTVTGGFQTKDQFSCGNDFAPKARKPYTITKQRERWTEDEHKKFLEALKLHGRAWRKIEEHVGSKTAVQIRSHAQKFFSKVVRDSSGSNTTPMEPIAIPPPRPKRKPMHPYPRKLAHTLVKDSPNPELSRRSSSPNFSVSEQENLSPTSVLSAFGSDAFGSAESNTPNGSLSPVSSAAPVHPVGLTLPQPFSSPEENGSPSPVVVTACSIPDEQSPMNVLKLDLFPQDVKDVPTEEASTRSLKLFGITVLVTDSHKPISTTVGTCKSMPSNTNEVKPSQLVPQKSMGTEPSSGDAKCTRSRFPQAAPEGLYHMQFQDENSNLVETDSGAPLLWWNLYGSVPFPFIPCHKQEAVKMNLDSNIRQAQDKEGSWTGSNGDDNFDKSSDGETQSCQHSFDKEEKKPEFVFEFKPSEKSAFSVIRTSNEKCRKGFVPYKRHMTERDTPSSSKMMGGDEREVQRIRRAIS